MTSFSRALSGHWDMILLSQPMLFRWKVMSEVIVNDLMASVAVWKIKMMLWVASNDDKWSESFDQSLWRSFEIRINRPLNALLGWLSDNALPWLVGAPKVGGAACTWWAGSEVSRFSMVGCIWACCTWICCIWGEGWSCCCSVTWSNGCSVASSCCRRCSVCWRCRFGCCFEF